MTVFPELDPFEYALEALPTDDPDGAALVPDRETYYANMGTADIVFTGDVTLKVGDRTFHLLHTPGHTPGQVAVYVPEERVGLHRRHDLLRVHDVADDVGRGPVDRTRWTGSARWTSTTSFPATGRSRPKSYLATPAGVPARVEGRRSRSPSRRAGRARRRSRGSASPSATRSTSGRNT